LRKGRKGEDADFRRLVGPQNSPAPRCDPNDDAFWVGWGAYREETCRALEDDGTSKTTESSARRGKASRRYNRRVYVSPGFVTLFSDLIRSITV
jgi:hypothetical protein